MMSEYGREWINRELDHANEYFMYWLDDDNPFFLVSSLSSLVTAKKMTGNEILTEEGAKLYDELIAMVNTLEHYIAVRIRK